VIKSFCRSANLSGCHVNAAIASGLSRQHSLASLVGMTTPIFGARRQLALIPVLLALLHLPAVGQTLQDDFGTYSVGSDGGPAWEPQSATWETVDGAYVGDSGISLWRAVPFAAAMTFACDVTVLELSKGDWLTAGIGFAADDKNYWALNLIVSPENLGRQPRTELQESVNGYWPAAGEVATRLKSLPGKGGGFNWRTNQTYRMEINLTPATVSGRILDGTNEAVQFGYEFAEGVKAVKAGRPILRVNGMHARFDNAVVTVTQTKPEPIITLPKVPAWASRPGRAIAPGKGFFRTAEVDGRWWLVDPEGKPFFAVGTDHVNYHAHFCEKLGYAPYSRNVQAKFGSEEAWATNAIERLKAWGFNELPAGHSPSLRHRGLPHIQFASLGTSFARRQWICEPTDWTGFPDVFSPRWVSHCRFTARETVRDSLGDPWCIGTFIDNELEWYGKDGELVDEVFHAGVQSSAKRAFWQWLLQQYNSVTEMNRQLATDYADEAAFLASRNVPSASSALTQVHEKFLAVIADRYFSVAAKALREADPDHLVLGCRFAGSVPAPVLAAAGKYNDVFTFNTYPRVDFENVWSPDGTGGVVERVPRELSDYFAVARKPILITEWSFPALDSGLPCEHGAGMRVDTQEQKAACYRIFVNAMADLPFLIGYHYFMWADEPALGISTTFPEDSNYGLVNEKDETYEVIVKAATEVNHAAESRHARSATSGDLELRKKGSVIEIANTNAIPAHGLVNISLAGRNRIEEISLAAGQSKQLPLPAQTVACVELQNWDGTKQRAVSGPPLGLLEVANVSANTLAGVPVLRDGVQPVAAWLSQLPPGRTKKLQPSSAEWTQPDRLELKTDGVTWSCSRKDGNLFDHIQADGLALGRLVFAIHQQAGGVNRWTECDRIESLRLQEQSDAWLIEAVVGSGEKGSANSFRAGVRVAVFKHDGLVFARPRWVENCGAQNWKLVEAFCFCRPAIGGSTDDDVVGGVKVPNYYRDSQFWTDAKLGGCFGALGESGSWRVNFWKSSATDFHPDARFEMEQELQPGAHWTTENIPFLWIFAGRDAAQWRKIADLARQARTSVLVGTDRR
jgi:hypothetical protein